MAQATIDTTVVAIQGVPVGATPPVVGQALVFNGTSWVPSASVNGPFGVTGLLTAGGITVNGVSTLTGNVTSSGNISTSGNLVTTGAGALTVAGIATMGGGITVSGGGISVSAGNISCSGTLIANGAATMNAGVTSNNGATITGGNLNLAGLSGQWSSVVYTIPGGSQSWQVGYWNGFSNNLFYWTVNGTAVGQIDGFGGWANPSGSWGTLSDPRVKANISSYESSLAAIVQLRPITFQYNGKGGTLDDTQTGTWRYGLDAIQVKGIMPELIKTTANQLDSTDETGTELLVIENGPLIYAIVNALKEVATRLAALEGVKA